MKPSIQRIAFAFFGGALLVGGFFFWNSTHSGASLFADASGGLASDAERGHVDGPHSADVLATTHKAARTPASTQTKKIQRNYPLLSGTGLSFAARRELGLSDDQCQEVNRIVHDTKAALQTEMISRMKRDAVFDKPHKKGEAYSIEAFPDVSAGIMQRAGANLEKVVGSLGQEVLGEIEKSSTYLGAGENDVLLTVNPEVVKGAFDDTGNPREVWVVSYSLLDPKTGGRRAGGVIDFSKFNEDFMNLFEEPGAPSQ